MKKAVFYLKTVSICSFNINRADNTFMLYDSKHVIVTHQNCWINSNILNWNKNIWKCPKISTQKLAKMTKKAVIQVLQSGSFILGH